jgi:hypothetical protein
MQTRLGLLPATEGRKERRAVESLRVEGNCVILAGPGSGKAKTLTIKMARMLMRMETPAVCMRTFNKECAGNNAASWRSWSRMANERLSGLFTHLSTASSSVRASGWHRPRTAKVAMTEEREVLGYRRTRIKG